MKSTIYIFIAIMISSILASALPKSGIKVEHTLSIQCTDKQFSQEKLTESANIIKARLKDFGIQKFKINIHKTEAYIDISVHEPIDFKKLVSLLTSKGKIEFYEISNNYENIKNSEHGKQLASTLNMSNEDYANQGILGYCNEVNKKEVELYIQNYKMDKPENKTNFCWSKYQNEDGDFSLYLLNEKASLDNSSILKSSVKNSSLNQPELMIEFDKQGALELEKLSKKNMDKAIAVVLDHKVIQAPIVRSEIKGGKCIITGNSTQNEVRLIHSLINNKELPLHFKLN